ncbi:hypothetical protein BGZ63DRAFT_454854 [Mariannaea sp. PMI_226]|nr:hypothetical protein BGZ63DRAFT_454854 [Mariannaea sp. PMI_226]
MLSNVFTLGLMALSARCATAAALPQDDLQPSQTSELEARSTPLGPGQYTVIFSSEANYQGNQDWHANLWTDFQCIDIGNNLANNVGSIFIGSADPRVFCGFYANPDCTDDGAYKAPVIQASHPDAKWADIEPKGQFQSFTCWVQF